MINFLRLKRISVTKSAKLFRSATEKHNLKKGSFKFGRGLRPKSREQNFATEKSSRLHGSLASVMVSAKRLENYIGVGSKS